MGGGKTLPEEGGLVKRGFLEPRDLILEMQLPPLEVGDTGVVGGGSSDLFPQFLLQCLVTSFQLRNMRLHGHGQYLPVFRNERHQSVTGGPGCRRNDTLRRNKVAYCVAFPPQRGGACCTSPCTQRYLRCCHRGGGTSRGWVGRLTQMTADEERELQALLERLRQEHRDLDGAIEALHEMPGSDQLQLARFKKRKLMLRDRIGFIEDQICPDIIA